MRRWPLSGKFLPALAVLLAHSMILSLARISGLPYRLLGWAMLSLMTSHPSSLTLVCCIQIPAQGLKGQG
jgi:hypothetical protein